MKPLLIFLHGVGSRGDDLVPLGEYLAAPFGADIANPDAPNRFDQGGPGRQWFSVSGVTEANRPARVAEARAGLDAVLTEIITTHGLQNNLSQVALIGFSQGSIMALDAVASGRWPVGAVVAFSGRLASHAPITPSKTPVLLVHGTADPVMPVAVADQALTSLKQAGVVVQLHKLSGVGHTISAEGAALAGKFLAANLVGTTKS